MNGMTSGTPARRAPATHYVLAAAFGLVVTLALSLAIAASNPDNFWLAAGICALCAIYPSVSLGIWLFVTHHTVTRDTNGEQSIELSWMRQAAAGAFLDVLVTTIIGSVLLMFIGPIIAALPALLALVGLSAADVGLRYAVVRHRALK